jgi:hypothetical protein
VRAFTVDNGKSWTVRFRRPNPIEVNEEGDVTETSRTDWDWVRFVDGESGDASWPNVS